MNETRTDHIGWLLEEHGITRKVYAAQRVLWPTLARVTFEDGSQEIHPKLNILSRDDLSRRYTFPV